MKRNRVRIFIGVLGIAIVAGLVWFWFARHCAGAKGRLVLYGNVDIRQVQLAFNDSERRPLGGVGAELRGFAHRFRKFIVFPY
jgi:hypothetical protein